MYCYKCGKEIDGQAINCVYCRVYVAHVKKPNLYMASMVFGFVFIFMPYLGFAVNFLEPLMPYAALLFGLAGLPLALASKRKAAIAVNIIGVLLWIMLIVTPYFSVEKPTHDPGERLEYTIEGGRIVAED